MPEGLGVLAVGAGESAGQCVAGGDVDHRFMVVGAGLVVADTPAVFDQPVKLCVRLPIGGAGPRTRWRCRCV
jgi:hypothetical protein